MQKSRRLKITDLNPHLTCVLCSGYLIDATTVIECLHSFCRTCIVKYLESNKYCPICDVQVHKTKPLLNIRSDQTLQDIVYKLVPGLFQNEMCRRRIFYANHPENKPSSAEESGQVTQFSHIYTADESISLSLEYYNNNKAYDSDNNSETKTEEHPNRRFLRCPAAVSISHIQKLIRAKYGLSTEHRVDVLYMNDRLNEDFTLMDIAYIYLWRRKGPLHLTYQIFEVAKRVKVNEIDECKISIKKEETDIEKHTSEEWKEVQLQISENGIMSVTNIEETVLPKSVSSNIVEVKKTDLGLIKQEIPEVCSVNKDTAHNILKDKPDEKSKDILPDKTKQNTHVTIPEKTQEATTENKSVAEVNKNSSEKDVRLKKHKLQSISDVNEPSPKIIKTNTSPQNRIAAVSLKNVQQLSRNHPLKIHSQAVNKSNSVVQNSQTTNIKALEGKAQALKPTEPQLQPCQPVSQVQTQLLPGPQPVSSENTHLQLKPANIALTNSTKSLLSKEKEPLMTHNADQIHSPLVQITQKSMTVDNIAEKPKISQSCEPPSSITTVSTELHVSKSVITNMMTPNIPKYTQAGHSSENTATTTAKMPDIQNSVAKLPVTSSNLLVSNNCIQSSKVSIVAKKSPSKVGAPIGYKTLRDPPKAWNPQISRQNLVKTNTYSTNNGASTSDANKSDSKTLSKPAKFFKMRNNMPRYLGNPASGVKPMYQVREGNKSPPEVKKLSEIKKPVAENKNNNNNKDDVKTKQENKIEPKNQQSIIKIDPKTLRPITSKSQESSSCSETQEMKINQSTVPIFNPLRNQKSQTSPKIDRRSPKSSVYLDIPNPPKSPMDRSSPKMVSGKPLNSPTSKKDKLSINFTPSNPFIPNLTSPNLAPNQFLYPNFPSYDPRVINNLSAYHNIPFSMFYSQPRLNYPGLSSPNLPLSPSLMSSLNLEVNKNIRKNYDISSMMQLSPTLDIKKPAACVKSYNGEKSKLSVEKIIPQKNSLIVKNSKSEKLSPESTVQESNNKEECRLTESGVQKNNVEAGTSLESNNKKVESTERIGEDTGDKIKNTEIKEKLQEIDKKERKEKTEVPKAEASEAETIEKPISPT